MNTRLAYVAAGVSLANSGGLLVRAQSWSTDVKSDLEGQDNSWGDLSNFTESVDINVDPDNTVQNGSGKNNCFQVS